MHYQMSDNQVYWQGRVKKLEKSWHIVSKRRKELGELNLVTIRSGGEKEI